MMDVATLRKRLGRKRRQVRTKLAPLLNRGMLAVSIDAPTIGFFAQLQWAISIISYCDRHSLMPLVRLVSHNYQSPELGQDWLSYFFEQPRLNAQQHRLRERNAIHWRSIKRIGDIWLPSWEMDQTFERVHQLVEHYLPLRPDVTSAIHSFVERHFTGPRMLGVHYRGTDKWTEAQRVPLEQMEAAIDEHLSGGHFDGMFVASDEQSFIDWVTRKYAAIMHVCCYEDSHRSADGAPPHLLATGNGFAVAQDALMNCLLLSRCAALIKTPSTLSACAKVFNPDLPTVMVGQPQDHVNWWPERDLPRWQPQSATIEHV